MDAIISNSIKEAKTDHPILDILKARWSARSFSDRPIEDEVLFSLFEAARWSPSSLNAQPWNYVYAHRSDYGEFKKFHECLLPGNQPWAAQATVMVLCLADRYNPNSTVQNRYNFYDVGAANASLLIEAVSRGIYGHLMGGYDMAKTKVAFDVPESLDVVCFLALGYLAEPEKLNEPFKTRELTPRSRKPVPDFVFKNKLKTN